MTAVRSRICRLIAIVALVMVSGGTSACATKGDVNDLKAEIARIDVNGKKLKDWTAVAQAWMANVQAVEYPVPGPADPPAAPPPPPEWDQ